MLRHALIAGVKQALRRVGLEVHRWPEFNPPPPPMSDELQWVLDIVERVSPYTMAPPERVASLCHALEYVTRANLPGDVVECGVWRGGSMMAAALALLHLKDATRSIYLFDTYQGMTSPTQNDKRVGVDLSGSEWLYRVDDPCVSPIDEVKTNLESTGYPVEKIHFIRGRVEDTIPDHAPEQICVLRLDTDWYESTRHELVHLYPRLHAGGVLIIDDYGWWDGARKATDEYIRQEGLALLLVRTDRGGGRIAIKT